MMELFRLLGRSVLAFLIYMGQLADLLKELGGTVRAGGWRIRLIAQQLVNIGFGSQVVVVVTGAFTGAVFTAQSYFKFKDFGVESGVGALVSVAMCRELGPVLAGLMVAGRVGAAMAAEIGTMKVTEQIDALRAMAVHPVDYLVMPRFVAMLISMPLLIAESITFGLGASYVVCVYGFDVPKPWFWDHVVDHTNHEDLIFGMSKGFVFGILITIISCHQGLTSSNGAVGVGRGTTNAVVYSSLAILISNFFLSFFLNYIFPLGVGL